MKIESRCKMTKVFDNDKPCFVSIFSLYDTMCTRSVGVFKAEFWDGADVIVVENEAINNLI